MYSLLAVVLVAAAVLIAAKAYVLQRNAHDPDTPHELRGAVEQRQVDNVSQPTKHASVPRNIPTIKPGPHRMSKQEIVDAMSRGVNPEELPRIDGYLVECTVDRWSTYVMRELSYLYEGLIQAYGWQELHIADVRKLLELSDKSLPEVLLVCERGLQDVAPHIGALEAVHERGVKIVHLTDDLQSLSRTTKEAFVRFFNVLDAYVGPYAYRLELHLSTLNVTIPELMWLPHSVSQEFTYLPLNKKPKRRVLLAGALGEPYPLRQWVQDNMNKLPIVDVLPHVGYEGEYGPEQSIHFASTMRTYIAAFTCTSLYHYIVAKVFEIPAVGGLLLLNNDAEELMASLGFHNGEHYIAYDPLDPAKAINYVGTANMSEIDQIRNNGMVAVRTNHTIAHRVYALQKYLALGIQTYPIPDKYKNGPCPMIADPDCIKRYSALRWHQ